MHLLELKVCGGVGSVIFGVIEVNVSILFLDVVMYVKNSLYLCIRVYIDS